MPRPYTLTTAKPFKGLRTNVDRSSLEKGEFSSLINFNTNRAGYIEKRKGIWRNAANKPTGTNQCGLLGISRSIVGTAHKPFMWVCHDTLLFKSQAGVIDNTLWFQYPSATINGVFEWMFEYGTVTQPYHVQIVRRNGQTIGIDPATDTVALGAGPAGTHTVPYKNRMWVLNTVPASLGEESRLYFSDTSGFNVWTGANAGFIDIEPGDGQMLVSMIVYNDVLYIFKNRSIWVLDASPDDPVDWQPRKLHDSIGCMGRGTPQLVEGFLFFLSHEGVYRTDGTTFEEISEPIRDQIQAINFTFRDNMIKTEAAYWDNKYVLNFGQSVAPQLYVYDIVSETWSTWSVNLQSAGVIFRGLATYTEYPNEYLFLGSWSGGNDSGYLYATASSAQEWYQDDTVKWTPGGDARNFTATAKLGGMDDDLPGEWKRNFYTALEASGNSTDQLQCIDASRTVTSEYTKILTGGRKFVRFPGIGRHRLKQTDILASTVAGQTGGPVKIFGVTYADEVRDRVHRMSGTSV